MEDRIQIIADTHEPGSLETFLWMLQGTIYSTGDHIPSGMSGPERELVDKLKASGVKDVRPELQRMYQEDPDYRKAVDESYQKTIMNQNIRKKALEQSKVRIISAAGNQDFAVGKKIVENYGGENILHDFKDAGLEFVFEPTVYPVGDTAVVLVPHNPEYRGDKRTFEEISEEITTDENIEEVLDSAERVLILSHQSIDCSAMGLPKEKVDAFTEPGNRALITAYYDAARQLVGPENVQLIHGHHHKPHL
jgi:hypothetical protein